MSDSIENERIDNKSRKQSAATGLIFGGIVMAVHSVVDFNLQMPASGWVLAALVGMALVQYKRMATVEPQSL